MAKVRVNSKYTFEACGWDIFDRGPLTPENGTVVRVINVHGCPKANTMGHCYVEDMDGNFRGLVCTGSLTKVGN